MKDKVVCKSCGAILGTIHDDPSYHYQQGCPIFEPNRKLVFWGKNATFLGQDVALCETCDSKYLVQFDDFGFPTLTNMSVVRLKRKKALTTER
ncbi:MAG: hypothetical protein IJ217_05670 [Clostridia bacterium]|nr:hypothetical protein [Clostridia bacterium]